jgi:hypothetical protein
VRMGKWNHSLRRINRFSKDVRRKISRVQTGLRRVGRLFSGVLHIGRAGEYDKPSEVFFFP